MVSRGGSNLAVGEVGEAPAQHSHGHFKTLFFPSE